MLGLVETLGIVAAQATGLASNSAAVDVLVGEVVIIADVVMTRTFESDNLTNRGVGAVSGISGKVDRRDGNCADDNCDEGELERLELFHFNFAPN